MESIYCTLYVASQCGEEKKKNRKRRKQEEPQKYGRGKIRLERESGKLEEEETESCGVGGAGETE